MTITNQTARTSAVGAGAVLVIPYLFPTSESGDLTVIQRTIATGAETTLGEGAATSGYTATYSSAGGTVTTSDSIAATYQVHVIRNTPNTQTLDLEAGGTYNAEHIESALDKNTKLTAENADKLTYKAITFPPTDASTLTTELPNSVDRASKNLTFDSDGNVAATVAIETGTASFTTFGTNMVEAANALAGKVVMNIDHEIDIRDYGAVGGGADDTTAIQAAVDANAQSVFIPEGQWLCNISVNGAVNIKGSGPKSILKAYTSDPVITVTARITQIFTGQGSAMGRRFENFTIDGNSKTSKGIYYSAATVEEEIVAVYFDNCTRGVDFGTFGAIANTVRYCNFVTCDYGIYAKDSGTSATGLNLNQFTENRFRSIALAAIYLNGSVISAAGNEFKSNWFDGIAGFGIILFGDVSDLRIAHANKLTGGWWELVPTTTGQVTLDDEGASDTHTIWGDGITLLASGTDLPADCLFDDSNVKADFYRGAGTIAAHSQMVITGASNIDIDEAMFDALGSATITPPATSSLIVRRPRTIGSQNRTVIIESLPMINNVSGHFNMATTSGLTGLTGGIVKKQNTLFLGSPVYRIILANADGNDIVRTPALTFTAGKFYAFSFSIKSSILNTVEDDVQVYVTGTNIYLNPKNIIARGDRWTHYVCPLNAPTNTNTDVRVRFEAVDTDAATYDISRLQVVEFDTQIACEEYLHGQNFAGDPYLRELGVVCVDNAVVCVNNEIVTL